MGSSMGSYTILFRFHNHSVHLAKSRGVYLCCGLSSQHISSVTAAGVKRVASGVQGQSDDRIHTLSFSNSGLLWSFSWWQKAGVERVRKGKEYMKAPNKRISELPLPGDRDMSPRPPLEGDGINLLGWPILLLRLLQLWTWWEPSLQSPSIQWLLKEMKNHTSICVW